MRKSFSEIITGNKKIVVLTAYTAPVAKAIDGIADIILVGDSVGMVLYGMPSTLTVTTEMMINHARAVVSASKKSPIVVDLPFGSYEKSPAQALATAKLIINKTGCQAVKLEGGSAMAKTVAHLVANKIPVIGHVGLLPQSVKKMGGYKIQGRDAKSAAKILADAIALEKAGAFAIVVEGVKEDVAVAITKKIKIPIIGIGASAKCRGQVLVIDDILGLTENPPKFTKKYANLLPAISSAAKNFANEVKSAKFPSKEHVYE